MRAAEQGATASVERVAVLTRDNPVQQARVERLRRFTTGQTKLIDEIAAMRTGSPVHVASSSLVNGSRESALSDSVRAVMEEMNGTERALLAERGRGQAQTYLRLGTADHAAAPDRRVDRYACDPGPAQRHQRSDREARGGGS